MTADQNSAFLSGAGRLSRRHFLTGAAGLAGLAVLPSFARAAAASAPILLTAKERPHLLPGCSAPSALWGYGGNWPLELRTPRGQPFTATFKNELAKHSSIHWHGLRIPLGMDGVPYFSQPPVQPGESFTYSFVPPDPGTFFFHPHCDTTEALSRGLAGVLVVEDPRDAGLFDIDRTLVLKDWRVRPDGSYLPFTTDSGAAKAGTLGSLRSVNGGEAPTIVAPPGAKLRLRLVNVDMTRICTLDARGAEAAVIATDGNACTPPFPISGWRLGPAMRADIAVIAPAKEGAEVLLEDVRGQTPQLLARIVTRGQRQSGKTSLAALRLPPAELPEPDLSAAERLEFRFQASFADADFEKWAKETGLNADAVCSSDRIFWSINGHRWPGASHENRPEPLAELKAGKSYIFELFNATQHPHPVHLHGHTFRVVKSSEKDLRPHWADTVLVGPKERVDIAFVAGQPGEWMLHCHIIEHQETGMMGYFRVV